MAERIYKVSQFGADGEERKRVVDFVILLRSKKKSFVPYKKCNVDGNAKV